MMTPTLSSIYARSQDGAILILETSSVQLKDGSGHDFEAAFDYLTLRYDADDAEDMVAALQRTPITARRANDILRAAETNPAALDDPGVKKSLFKLATGGKISPVLLITASGNPVIIADGHHRISLAYHLDPYTPVPLREAWIDNE